MIKTCLKYVFKKTLHVLNHFGEVNFTVSNYFFNVHVDNLMPIKIIISLTILERKFNEMKIVFNFIWTANY